MAFTRLFDRLRDRALLERQSFLFAEGFFFLFLANQYRAMEGGLATRRFPKGIYDPLKNPWRDFSKGSIQMHGRDWRGRRSRSRGMERVGSRGTPESPHTGHRGFFYGTFVGPRKCRRKKSGVYKYGWLE